MFHVLAYSTCYHTHLYICENVIGKSFPPYRNRHKTLISLPTKKSKKKHIMHKKVLKFTSFTKSNVINEK